MNDSNMESGSKAIKKDEEVQDNPDPHIDQDYPGFPHLPSSKEIISPKTAAERELAGISKEPSEKKQGN